MNKYLKIFLTIGIVIVLPFAAFTLVSSKMDLFGLQSFVVLTGSMSPTIPQGSISFAKKQPSYQSGEVITFLIKGGQTVTHRIVDVVEENGAQKFRTKGDANNTFDSQLVATPDILGATIFHIPHVGKFILFLKTLPGFISFIIIPGILLMGFELWNVKREMEKEIRKKIEREKIQVAP